MWKKGLLRKIGHYCNNCDAYYDMNYKLYTVYNVEAKSEYESISKSRKNLSKLYDNYNEYTEKAKYMGRVGCRSYLPVIYRSFLANY